MKLQRLLADMPDRPPSAREILLALISQADARLLPGGGIEISFQPDEGTLQALMLFDACEREDEQIDERPTEFHGSGSRCA